MSENQNPRRPGRSTGPRSSNGKQNSSRNSLTHGLTCAKFILIPGEDEKVYQAHAQSWADEYESCSDSPLFAPLLDDVIQAHWLQKRACKRVLESEMALATAELNREASEVVEEIFKRLQRMTRYKTTCENSFQRAFRLLEAFRKRRGAERLAVVRLVQAVSSAFKGRLEVTDDLLEKGLTMQEAFESVKELTDLAIAGRNPVPKSPPENLPN